MSKAKMLGQYKPYIPNKDADKRRGSHGGTFPRKTKGIAGKREKKPEGIIRTMRATT